jgi:hypothetical protein
MGFIVFGDDDQSAGFFVEAVHDSGTKFAPYSGQTREMMQQSIHQRAAIVIAFGWARADVDHHSRRLVDYGEIVIFVADVEWDIFGYRAQRRTLSATEHADALTSAQFERSLGGRLIDQHFFSGDQFLHSRATYAFQPRDHELVKAFAGVVSGDQNGDGELVGHACQWKDIAEEP